MLWFTKHRWCTRDACAHISTRFQPPELNGNIPSEYAWKQTLIYATRVENILAGVSEQGKILHSSPEFVLLPDMKWDGRTVTSLYLLAIVRDRTIRCLRDLRKTHVGLLKSIQSEALRIVQEKWGLGDGSVRFFIHYQPSYCELAISVSTTCLTKVTYHVSRSLPCAYCELQLSREHYGAVRRAGTFVGHCYLHGRSFLKTSIFQHTHGVIIAGT